MTVFSRLSIPESHYKNTAIPILEKNPCKGRMVERRKPLFGKEVHVEFIYLFK